MTRTLTAFYDSHDDAERAQDQLVQAGVDRDDVTISRADSASSGGGSSASGSGGGFMQGLKKFFMSDEDRDTYHEGLRRGGCLLTAYVPEGLEDRAIQVLDNSGAVDFDAREQQWRSEGWSGGRTGDMSVGSDSSGLIGSTGVGAAATPQSTSGMSAGSPGSTGMDRLDARDDASIPIAEERLAIGKREVDRGTVRVRSYVQETPVHEQVHLREEHVDIERRPVNERISGQGDGLFEERSFEVSEHGEEAVVGKETVVTEEVRVHKDVEDRVQDIDDTVRHTEVDVDDERTGGLNRTQGSDERPQRGF